MEELLPCLIQKVFGSLSSLAATQEFDWHIFRQLIMLLIASDKIGLVEENLQEFLKQFLGKKPKVELIKKNLTLLQKLRKILMEVISEEIERNTREA